MGKKRIFSLDPDQLERLLSIGTGGEDPAKDQKQRPQDDNGHAAARQKSPQKKKKDTKDSVASMSKVFEQPGDRIGQYKLLRILGEGGMGIAYLAEQEQPIKRQVALKVIKPGMDTRRVIARFKAERQALALLDHPNIAHIYEAGTTNSGRPYFAMEYVKGLPITEHCDRHRLTIEERLKIFLQICYAVHHAHQKGIIHRDIKPSNILISYQDDQAVPKIIDFGVAKAINQPLTERTVFIEQGQLFGTPEYMSPEQADMANEDIDTRSDIYSLGVLLYVLLTGALPFDSETLRKGGIEHIRQVIRETDPKTPSTQLSSMGDEAAKVAESRCIELSILAKRLHSELEWIPLKAMRKERSERYRSASELADDIENYLENKALIAGPPGTVYQLKKLIRRHQALVAGVAIVLVVLILGIVASMVFAIRANHARAEAQAVSGFLRNSVLASLDPFKVRGKEITIRSVLDTASENIQAEFKGTPLAEAEIQDTLGNAYWSLGLFKQAELHLKRAWDIQKTQWGPGHPAALASAHQLGWVYFAQSRYSEAEKFLAHASNTRRRLLGEENSDTIYSTIGLACVYNMQGRLKKAEELLSKVLEITHRVLGKEHPYVPAIINATSWCYEMQGRYTESEELARQGLEIARRVLGENDWFALLLKHTIARVCMYLGKYDEAEKLLQEALSGRQLIWGQEHPDTLETMVSLGSLYCCKGLYKKAEMQFNQALEDSLRILGDIHLTTAGCMHESGKVYLIQGQYNKSELLLKKASEITNHILGEESWASLIVNNTMGKLYTLQGRYELAQPMLLKVLETRQRVLGNEHPDVFVSMNDLALLYMKQGDFDKANDLFNETLNNRQEKLGEDHPATLESKNDLAALYRAQELYDKAEKLLIEAVEGRRLKLGNTHPHTLESWKNLIELYEAWGKPEKAKEWQAKLPQTETVDE
jgi:serine/threonine protein kinase/lipopolysaccharide biosynthesis regulator YciM